MNILQKFRTWRNREITPYKVIMVDGGFCSTLVKYALGRSIETKLGIEVKYDLSWFDQNGMDCDNIHERKFQLLEVFPELKFDVASQSEIQKAKKKGHYHNRLPYQYCEDVYSAQTQYIDGYYEHWKYMQANRKELIDELDFTSLDLDSKNTEVLKCIKNTNSIAVHARRGDFVNLGLCILDADYYRRAIQEVVQRVGGDDVHIFFFSNDMDWVRENVLVGVGCEHTLVDFNNNNLGYLDLFLISCCNHQISSNSSFGFWGGFLNQNENKIVAIPEKWLPKEEGECEGALEAHLMPEWITVNIK